MNIKTISSKVTPIDVGKPSSVRVNNFLEKDTSLVNRLRFLVIAESLLGINRLRIIKVSRILVTLCHFYSIFLVVAWFYYALTAGSGNTFSVMKYSSGLNLMISMFFAATTQVDSLQSINKKMYEIDHTLNITNESNLLNKATVGKYILGVTLTYSIIECILFKLYMEEDLTLLLLLYVALMAQDCEQVLYSLLLRSIGFRLQIIKAHVVKTLSRDEVPEVTKKIGPSSVENLADKTNLDVKSLLGLYESLHHCSQEVTYLIGVPVSGTKENLLLRAIKSGQ